MPLGCPRYFQVINGPMSGWTGTPQQYILICDNYGVYKIGPLVDGAVPVVMSNRSLTQNDYENLQLRLPLTGWVSGDFLPTSYVPLSATSAQELPNGNWLITNNYSGDDQYKNWLAGIPAVDDSSSDVSSFGGEIFELQWPTGTTPEQIILDLASVSKDDETLA